MKLALILIRKSRQAEPIILHDSKGKPPPMMLLGWPEQLSLLLVVAVAGLWMWFGLIEPRFRDEARPAIRVPRAVQVVALEADAQLTVGDIVFVHQASKPSAAMVTALPRQSFMERQADGRGKLVILGENRYYVVAENGTGQILARNDIRGRVQQM